MEKELQESNYIMGYSGEFQQLLRRRSAETNAAHLLPHLKPGSSPLGFRLWARVDYCWAG